MIVRTSMGRVGPGDAEARLFSTALWIVDRCRLRKIAGRGGIQQRRRAVDESEKPTICAQPLRLVH